MNKTLLKKAIASLSIIDVTLLKLKVEIKDDFDALHPYCEQMIAQFKHGPDSAHVSAVAENSEGEEKRILRAYYNCAFRLIENAFDGDPPVDEAKLADKILVVVEAKFCAYYWMKEDISEDAIDEFVTNNVGYHVWPYWRELATSTAMRIRIPPVIPPLYTVPQDAQKTE
ncbi:MAG: hypothetical protein KC587_14570 [Nitrospira sp.]|nr:hypothetical protein [Nitrospira sp.]MCB1851583.1 hypothetical protein [Gammaproteobacteria bacterium]